ncbi:MAG: hypothetical protein RLY31_1911 [Bacteroidota bacterium]|jgi:hypothetical protein
MVFPAVGLENSLFGCRPCLGSSACWHGSVRRRGSNRTGVPCHVPSHAHPLCFRRPGRLARCRFANRSFRQGLLTIGEQERFPNRLSMLRIPIGTDSMPCNLRSLVAPLVPPNGFRHNILGTQAAVNICSDPFSLLFGNPRVSLGKRLIRPLARVVSQYTEQVHTPAGARRRCLPWQRRQPVTGTPPK